MNTSSARLPLLILGGALLLALGPLVLPPFYVRVGQLMLYSAGLGVAWAILGGFAGYGSFGHAAFIGVGAFTAGLVENQFPTLAPALLLLLGLAAGAGACAVISALVAYPILRLRGTFFAIAMLGVCHVCAEVNNNVDFFQGSMGINFAPIAPASMDPAVFFYWLYLAASTIVLLIAWAIWRSRFGAGLLSIREDEDTARMLGVPTERYKRQAFVISAVLTGLLGVIYAHALGYITTDSVYRDDTNLSLIVFSLLGGMGTLFGPVIGAFLLVFVTQVILGRLLDFHLFATGLLLVLLVLMAPGGVIGLVRGWRLRRRSEMVPAE
ncbi:branched-chain amino acid transport system permease protein [Enhydrobacter aerosaccus]|uniref:Branched-chain amino acid transport system permease protein n=1 Tax=Enhydrobacter aerosaccus TaxID=225324 RepID=A0A1T4RX39_9HYPH|nr:branched-chain amino acid ABC transporter permease [Enhydrobacter aerosaccus]SKA20522.1 branched-chain amino acid transport system permease protein [Enhydrobacter aerosaccus]